jgi:hypothetical protein
VSPTAERLHYTDTGSPTCRGYPWNEGIKYHSTPEGLHKGCARCDYTTPLGLKLLCHNENLGLPDSWQPQAVELNRYAVLKAQTKVKIFTAVSAGTHWEENRAFRVASV